MIIRHAYTVTRDARQTVFAASALCYVAICIILLVEAWRLPEVVASESPQAQGIDFDRSIVAASFILLIYLGWLARRKSGVTAGHALMLGVVRGVLFFAGPLGSALVDPHCDRLDGFSAFKIDPAARVVLEQGTK